MEEGCIPPAAYHCCDTFNFSLIFVFFACMKIEMNCVSVLIIMQIVFSDAFKWQNVAFKKFHVCSDEMTETVL